jgi:hypothetical protein
MESGEYKRFKESYSRDSTNIRHIITSLKFSHDELNGQGAELKGAPPLCLAGILI